MGWVGMEEFPHVSYIDVSYSHKVTVCVRCVVVIVIISNN